MQLLHVMVRVKNIEKSIEFFSFFGLKEARRLDFLDGRFTLVYLKDEFSSFELELTHNWDQKMDYSVGNNFGHIAFSVNNIYETCQTLKKYGAVISRPPRDGSMAFIKSPDGISIELLQKGQALPLDAFWKNEPTIGTW
ncbi:Lactoylglutathione lyase [hydrothermal vent metagenome]|uniref:Lactoylglutathione lyase n=1 Tax=hydrothermal vent metagenome TaxID=652676 RepID=A0A3B0Z310_9ZZZZ